MPIKYVKPPAVRLVINDAGDAAYFYCGYITLKLEQSFYSDRSYYVALVGADGFSFYVHQFIAAQESSFNSIVQHLYRSLLNKDPGTLKQIKIWVHEAYAEQ